MFKKSLKILLKSMLSIVAFLAFYLLLGYILSSIRVSEEANAADELDIYILTNGVHSDIVVPANTEYVNWHEKMNHLDPSVDKTAYTHLAIGWGDKGFYLNTPSWAELKARTALKAMVGWSGTAVHATYYKGMYEGENCTKIQISAEQYKRLIAYITASFDLNKNGEFIKIETEANKGMTDAFYEATGRYHIFNTCNSWTNKGLKMSGQHACLWTAFQQPIFKKYR